MSPILITGATGHIGTHLIKQLAAKGYPVRALVHSREKAAGLPQEVERVTGDLARPATLSAAVDGVDRVFLLDPSTGLDFTRNMVEVSLQVGVRLIVDLSSIGAGLDPVPILLRSFSAREAIIKDSGMAWTILRPGQFMSNALWWRPSIQAERVVRDPVGPGHLASIDPADIAAVAAIALTQEGHAGEIYTLTGDELLTTKMNWARHVAPPVIRLIGSLEILGALGLIVPKATGSLPWLTPVAAVGLVLTMLGAILMHVRLHEAKAVGVPVLLLLLALFIAVGSFVFVPVG
jgi:uncharacterized protein YbjT (DUF2867 family)